MAIKIPGLMPYYRSGEYADSKNLMPKIDKPKAIDSLLKLALNDLDDAMELVMSCDGRCPQDCEKTFHRPLYRKDAEKVLNLMSEATEYLREYKRMAGH